MARRPTVDGLAPPEGLTEAQRQIWAESLATIRARNGEKRVNRALLETYCRALDRMRQAEEHVAAHGPIVKAPRTGLPMQNPYLAVANRAAATVGKVSRQLGLEDDAEPPKPKPKPIALSTYAKRRGCSAEAVCKAVASGRLRASVVEVRGKPKIADPELADREWSANTRPAGDSAPAPATEGSPVLGQISYAEARRRREVELWRQAETKAESDRLDLEVKRGSLVPVDEARETVLDAFTTVRTRLLAVASRCRQRIPRLKPKDVQAIEDLIREALEELADGGD